MPRESEKCHQCGGHDADLISGACHVCAEIAVRYLILATITLEQADALLTRRREAVYHKGAKVDD